MPSCKLIVLSLFSIGAIVVAAALWIDRSTSVIYWGSDFQWVMAANANGHLYITYMKDSQGTLGFDGWNIDRSLDLHPLLFDKEPMAYDFLGISLGRSLPSPPISVHFRGYTCGLPLWLVMVLLAIAPAIWMVKKLRHRIPEGHCPKCGYDIRHASGACPECGRALNRKFIYK